jgi:hypothetical protein
MHALTRLSSTVALFVGGSVAAAQALPPVRPLGPALAISAEPMVAVSQVRALPGGRVLVNDNTGRRLLLFDSTLAHFTVVADTTAATAHAYGATLGGLIAYRGDTTLFVDPGLLAMLVIDPNGKIVRTLAVPNPNEVNFLIGGPYGTAGLDQQGRLVYKARVGGFGNIIPAPVLGVPPPPDIPDSAMVVRFDLVTRKVDTVAKFIGPSFIVHNSVDENHWVTHVRIVNPIQWVDDWALLMNGRVAVIRGQEYRVDIFDAAGTRVVTSKLPFDWLKLDDAAKSALIDSTRAAMEAANPNLRFQDAAARQADSARIVRHLASPEATIAPTRSGGGPAGNSTTVTAFVALNEMPDYRPPFRLAAARGDLDGNLWIRTTKMVNGGAVYDVINSQGVLIDRIQVPPGRVIAGFGSDGVVYMGVLDGTVARLERAQVHLATHP